MRRIAATGATIDRAMRSASRDANGDCAGGRHSESSDGPETSQRGGEKRGGDPLMRWCDGNAPALIAPDRPGSAPVTAHGAGGALAGRAVTTGVFVRSSLFALGLVCSTLVFTPIALASTLLPYRFRWRAVTRWSRFNVYWLSVTCGVRCEVEGLENVPAEPAVVLARHESAWETLALQRYFAPQVWVLKRELLRIPFFGWGLATMRPIAIDRGAGLDAFEQMLSQGAERLASGCWVVVFPEGTRTPPGVRRPVQEGRRPPRRPHRPPRGSGRAQCRGLLAEEQLLQVPRHHPRGHRRANRDAGRSAVAVNRIAEQWIDDTLRRIRGAG